MNNLMDSCFLCTKDFNCVIVDDTIVSQMEYLVPEITIFKLNISLRICSVCNDALFAFNKFKQFCMESSRRLEASIKGALDPSQNPLPPEKVPQDMLHTDTNPDNTEEIVVKEEKPEETQIQESCDNILRNTLHEQYSSPEHNTDGGSAASDTSTTSVIKTEIIEEIIIKEEHLEEPPEDINIYNMVQCTLKDDNETKTSEQNTEINSATLNTSEKCNTKPSDKEIYKNVFQNTLDENILTNETYETIPQRTEQIFIPEPVYLTSKTKMGRKKVPKKTNSDRIFQCETCKKIYKNISSLNQHKKIHSGIKEYECDICGKAYTKRSTWEYHMKTHTGVKDFACLVCKKLFRSKNNVSIHMKIHSNVKDFVCSICNKSFVSNARLNRHMKYHSEVRKYQCELCNKSFTQRVHYNHHKKVHAGIKDFPCSICNKAFTCRSAVNQHMKKIHSKDFQPD